MIAHLLLFSGRESPSRVLNDEEELRALDAIRESMAAPEAQESPAKLSGEGVALEYDEARTGFYAVYALRNVITVYATGKEPVSHRDAGGVEAIVLYMLRDLRP